METGHLTDAKTPTLGDTAECENCEVPIEYRSVPDVAKGAMIKQWMHRHDTYMIWSTREVVPRDPPLYIRTCTTVLHATPKAPGGH